MSSLGFAWMRMALTMVLARQSFRILVTYNGPSYGRGMPLVGLGQIGNNKAALPCPVFGTQTMAGTLLPVLTMGPTFILLTLVAVLWAGI